MEPLTNWIIATVICGCAAIIFAALWIYTSIGWEKDHKSLNTYNKWYNDSQITIAKYLQEISELKRISANHQELQKKLGRALDVNIQLASVLDQFYVISDQMSKIASTYPTIAKEIKNDDAS